MKQRLLTLLILKKVGRVSIFKRLLLIKSNDLHDVIYIKEENRVNLNLIIYKLNTYIYVTRELSLPY